ncbi:MAG: 2-C-methyl-D-erythritol 4-phosphate cytidylyltransferase [Planctomycetota bacterium]|jgi:2-C-methyl-D-erythritol 4-phosphate cytidylyltransferase
MFDESERAPYAAAVLVAAGRSTRMGSGPPKPLLPLAGATVLAHAIAAFVEARSVASIVVVIPEFQRADFEAATAHFGDAITALVAGGAERTHSALAGLLAVPEECSVTLVHDAARPLVKPEHIDAVAKCARSRGAGLLAVPVNDTLHHSEDGEHAQRVIDRSALWSAQTPQGFRTSELRELLEAAIADGRVATDEAALYEAAVGPIPLVHGSPTNIKLTTPDDLRMAAALLAPRTL